jgi:hypothetical protein
LPFLTTFVLLHFGQWKTTVFTIMPLLYHHLVRPTTRNWSALKGNLTGIIFVASKKLAANQSGIEKRNTSNKKRVNVFMYCDFRSRLTRLSKNPLFEKPSQKKLPQQAQKSPKCCLKHKKQGAFQCFCPTFQMISFWKGTSSTVSTVCVVPLRGTLGRAGLCLGAGKTRSQKNVWKCRTRSAPASVQCTPCWAVLT